MRTFIFSSLFFLTTAIVVAQPYTQPQFAVGVEKNITYGTAKNFAGNDEDLKLDIYKPLNNTDIARPVYLHVHGGSWLEISNKDAAEDITVCMEMAKKGYVAVNVEYRRGYHRLNYYVPYALCSTLAFPNQSDCIYVQDTSEVVRAIYRGMQDAKAAIRFMKGRHAVDSTNVNAVCIGGESAGGFIAMYAGYLTCADEKPAACFALPNALPTDADLADCNPATILLARPDLGSIEGEINMNGYDATVAGVANYYGGIMHPIIPGPKPPVLYLFHQKSDVIVDCDYKMPILSFFEQVIYPLNLCQPLYTIPKAWGSCSIATMLADLGPNAPAYNAQIINNGPPNSLANPPGHAYDNIVLRTTQAAALFSPYVTGQAQAPQGINCIVSDSEPFTHQNGITISPNPFRDHFQMTVSVTQITPTLIRMTNIDGKVIYEKQTIFQQGENTITVDLQSIPGVYFITINVQGKTFSEKIAAF